MDGDKPRVEDRASVILRAWLREGSQRREACLLDLSSRGLMATSEPAPARGSIIELVVGRHSLVGQVQWAEDRRFGVKLRERIDVLAVLGNEAGPTALKAAQAARGKSSVAARYAFSRQVARGFVFGLMLSGGIIGAVSLSKVAAQSLSSLNTVSATLEKATSKSEPAR